MTAIETCRRNAGLQIAEVASAVGREASWLKARESGEGPLDASDERVILTAIKRLEHFHQTVIEAKEKLTADLKLPPLRVGPSRPRQPVLSPTTR